MKILGAALVNVWAGTSVYTLAWHLWDLPPLHTTLPNIFLPYLQLIFFLVYYEFIFLLTPVRLLLGNKLLLVVSQ